MRPNAYLFYFVSAFFIVSDLIYWFTSKDPTGTTALAFAAMLGFLIAYYLHFNARRLPPQPEDELEAEIEDGAGEIGFFSPHSVWPFYLGVGAALLALGLVFKWWLFLIGAGVFGMAALGFVMEYYVSVSHGAGSPDHFHS
jgi:Cytochrome c oxidase subunit IV